MVTEERRHNDQRDRVCKDKVTGEQKTERHKGQK